MCPAAEIQFVAHPWPKSEKVKKAADRGAKVQMRKKCKCPRSREPRTRIPIKRNKTGGKVSPRRAEKNTAAAAVAADKLLTSFNPLFSAFSGVPAMLLICPSFFWRCQFPGGASC